MRYDPETREPIGKADVITEGLQDPPAILRKPRMQALLRSWLVQVQECENAAWDLFAQRFLRDAKADQLDGWGRLVLEPRLGEADEPYRVRIRVRIAVNRSRGNLRDLRAVASLAIGHESFRFWSGSKAIVLYVFEPVATAATGPMLRAWFARAKAAGESFALVRSPSTPALRLRSKSDPIPGPGEGLGTKTNASLGGRISGVY